MDRLSRARALQTGTRAVKVSFYAYLAALSFYVAVLLEYGLLSIFREAGWPIWPLLATSVLGLALIFERMLSLRRGHGNSPLGRILAEVMRHRHLSPQALRASVEDTGRAIAHELNRYIPALGTIAVIAPLMGLFGTVVGMIEIFSAYTPGGGDPTQLARGISIALYNTGFGILIAIPAMIAHRWLCSRIDNYLHLMEQAATRLIRANATYAEARA